MDDIIGRLSDGEPLAQICRTPGYPHPSTFRDWVNGDDELTRRFARARADGFDAIAEQALEIADTPVDGVIEKLEPNEAGELTVVERRREDMLGHRKLQVETRLKLLAKWDPKRYGERQRVEHSGNIGLEALVAGSGETDQAEE